MKGRQSIMMKSSRIILLVLIGVLFISSFGCGGGGGVDSQGDYEPEDEQIDEAVASLLEKIITPDDDGSPMIFNYAPKLDSPDETAVAAPQKLDFVKYISSKDLNSDGAYVTTIHLNQGSEYVIKYSHGGRTLSNSLLGVRITDPEKTK